MCEVSSGGSLEGSYLTRPDDCIRFDLSSASNVISLWFHPGECIHYNIPVGKDVRNGSLSNFETLCRDSGTEIGPWTYTSALVWASL